MEHFVTLFNSLYLPQGLALHQSMERHVREYVLWILCLDDETYGVLKQLALPNIKLLKLSSLETDQLLSVKYGRTITEYCWTLTPFAPRFVFEAEPTAKRVTYLDADLWFRKNPKPIFDEFDSSAKSVLITDHAYAPEYDRSATSGQFCVQFMTFQRDGGEQVRSWWEHRCLEWCYARPEDGKFGDQKYLDDWPERFGDFVHVLQNCKLTLAPWNGSRFPYGSAIFYHFHGLRLVAIDKVELGAYSLPDFLLANVYVPYLADLRVALDQLECVGYYFTPQASSTSVIRHVLRKLNHLRQRLWNSLSPPRMTF